MQATTRRRRLGLQKAAHNTNLAQLVIGESCTNFGQQVKFHKNSGANGYWTGSSDFYRLVAKPLMSMGTVGSMDCERRAKPLKNIILVKGRNRMKDPTGVKPLSYHACEEDAWKEAC
eukprot:scaffold7779_cov107-Skeletonema_menzelii.AAC.3